MSQEPPSPKPESHNSINPPRSVKPVQTQKNSDHSVLKTQTLKILRGTIRALEGVVVKLEAPTEPTSQPSWLDKGLVAWNGVLAKIRSLLPQNLSSSLSDTGLTGIIAAIAVILVWTTSSVLSSQPPKEVATTPPASSPVILPQPELSPSPTVTTPPQPELDTPTVASSPQPESTPTIPIPPELTTPQTEPQPVEVTPIPTPEVVVELTPEQTLIAAIENQLAQVAENEGINSVGRPPTDPRSKTRLRFANGLIQSIQANFESSSLTLKLGNDWYNLKPDEQDSLAARMLERSRELDFTRLEITDTQGKLLARSPIVGKDMVIFKRGA